MKLQHVLFLSLTVLAASPARSERVLWTETATIKTKTIFGADGQIVSQENWDKATGQPIAPGGSVASMAPPPAAPPYMAAATPPSSPVPGGYATPPPNYQYMAAGQGWVQGPFQASAAAPAHVQVGTHPSPITAPEGRENPHPEWSRLYREANAPMPERDGYTLPPPPPMYAGVPGAGMAGAAPGAGGSPQMVGRPLHPDIPGEGDRTWFNRVGGKVLMRPDNMVRVKVIDQITSKRNKRGDTFRYVLLDPIMYGLRTLVPAGTKGMGRVGRSKARGFFGRPGMLDLEFGSVDLPGATPARIYLAETVISPEPREPEAIGAAGVGLIAFGPLGLAGGAMIRGHDVSVEAGSVFHVEVAVDVPYMHTASR